MHCLMVVPTPIGNLEDITLRAVRVLGEVALILAEDTRQTRKLLNHYGIATRLLSYHQHNKRERLTEVLQVLAADDVAIVSNAGMPSIADPGFELIEAAVAAGCSVDVLPGASAIPTAVVAAAIPAPGFLFGGFLPRRPPDRRARLRQVGDLEYSLVFYEAPHRVRATLRDINATLGDRRMVACREMTKLHQEFIRGRVSDLVERYAIEQPRGEFTLVVAGNRQAVVDRTDEARVAMHGWVLGGVDRKTALARLAAEYGVNRNTAYALWLDLARGDDQAAE